VKLLLTGPDNEIETPWAEQVGDGLFRLDNMPFFAYGISADDIVEASPTENEGMFRFERVVRPSGNRTVRVIFEEGRSATDADGQAMFERLVQLGAEYEGANPSYVVVTVPPATDLSAVTALFTELGLRWEYANPTYEQIHGTSNK
jgi:hypothetical protein